MNGGEISGNTASSSYNSNGGGVCNSGIFTMKGGEISGNINIISSNNSGGGGVFTTNSSFTKSGGIITGYLSDPLNGNVVKDSSGVVQNNRGHAVYVFSGPKRRESTAGPGVNLDSSKTGTAGGWE